MTKKISIFPIIQASLLAIAITATASYSAFAMLDNGEVKTFKGTARGLAKSVNTLEKALTGVQGDDDAAVAEKATLTAGVRDAKGKLQRGLEDFLAVVRNRTMLVWDDTSLVLDTGRITAQTRIYKAQVATLREAQRRVTDSASCRILAAAREVAEGNLAFWDKRDRRILKRLENPDNKTRSIINTFFGFTDRVFDIAGSYPKDRDVSLALVALSGVFTVAHEVVASTLAFWDKGDECILDAVLRKDAARKAPAFKRAFAGRIFGIVAPYPENYDVFTALVETLKLAAGELGVDLESFKDGGDTSSFRALSVFQPVALDGDIDSRYISERLKDPAARAIYSMSREGSTADIIIRELNRRRDTL